MAKTGTDALASAGGFRVSCDADKAGRLLVDTNSLWVRVGQSVLRKGTQEMWDSVVVEGKRDQDGTLVLRVIVFNPDWGEPLQIASIQSRPYDPDCHTALGCNLDHVAL